MNITELNNKKNEAIESIKNRLLQLIKFEDEKIKINIGYRSENNNDCFVFSIIRQRDDDYNNEYSLMYNVQLDKFTLIKNNTYTSNTYYYDDGVDVLEIHKQLNIKKKELDYIVNTDF